MRGIDNFPIGIQRSTGEDGKPHRSVLHHRGQFCSAHASAILLRNRDVSLWWLWMRDLFDESMGNSLRPAKPSPNSGQLFQVTSISLSGSCALRYAGSCTGLRRDATVGRSRIVAPSVRGQRLLGGRLLLTEGCTRSFVQPYLGSDRLLSSRSVSFSSLSAGLLPGVALLRPQAQQGTYVVLR